MPRKTPASRSEQRLVEALRALGKTWPKGYWLFANGQSLYLMREGENGERKMAKDGGVDPAAVVESFAIPNDGGDW